jgi:predicted dehydrogenase
VSDVVRVGLVGCGAIARHVHLRSLRRMRGVSVAALADPSPDALAAAQRLAPEARLHSSLTDLLEDQLDAIVVASPSGHHAEHGAAVLSAGRSLFLEKPAATDAEGAARLREAATAADGAVVATVGFNRRFHPLFRDLRRVVREGTVGRPRLVRTAFCEPTEPAAMPAWKASRATGGGALLDLASHHIDYLRWLIGADVDSVSASLASEATEHDTADVRLRLDGVEAHLHASFRGARLDAVEIIGDRGVARAERYSRTLVVTTTSARSHSSRRRGRIPSAATARYRFRALVSPALEPSYLACLGAFAAAVRGERRPTELATIADGLAAVATVLAAEQAAVSGGPVRLG